MKKKIQKKKKLKKKNRYLFHLIIRNGLAFLCMSEKEFGSAVPYSLLEELQKEFLFVYKEKWRNARENEMKDFMRNLSQLVVKKKNFFLYFFLFIL